MKLKHLDSFLQEIEHMRGLSRNTLTAYQHDLKIYAEFRAETRDLRTFPEFLTRRNISRRSQARIISTLRTFYRFIESRGEKAPELRELKIPKFKTKLPRPITHNEFKKLYAASSVESDELTSRNQVTLLLLFGLGCRVSELIGIDLQRYHEKESWLSVTGKGGRERIIPIAEHINERIKKYLEWDRPSLLIDGTQSLLLNNNGRRPTRMDIWRWLQVWAKIAKLSREIGPHDFRHGYAVALFDSGADLRSIQELLGHASILTTQIYTSVSTKNQNEAIDNFHPLSKENKNE